MKHEGHSGFALEMENDHHFGKVVRKWTVGNEAVRNLNLSYMMQARESIAGELYPVRSVGVTTGISKETDKGPYFAFLMPFQDGESGFTEWRNRSRMSADIVTSMRARSRNECKGFKNIILDEISRQLGRCNIDAMKSKVLILSSALVNCPDTYPSGYAHGDFGFANMIIDQDGRVYMIDFTPSFIYSPLMDQVTMELSLMSPLTMPWHRWLYEKIEVDLEKYKQQKEILRMTKVLSFIQDNQTKERRKEIDMMYYGTFRSSNI